MKPHCCATGFLIAILLLGVLTSCSRPGAINNSSTSVKHITQPEFDAEVTQFTNAVVVDFYAAWCGPCRVLSPMLDRLAEPFTNQIKFVKVNVDESPGITQHFKVQSIPTLIFFKDGKVAERITGLPEEADLKAKLEALAAK